ncbi:MAG: hypothetical protein UY26_C0003G0253 [Candidatus Jorgensenbacteria bacterium GW2011_GWA1_48_13]|uniref:Uncharacterized protein n=1 Tax=Candidatus Jorgensenbacteria bacterium GW2011_GWB1_50_10 TaxID=1618665 RepID=A0A0G1W7W3_9BACT|nr:MAG: hypothetical protein UY26_C0003G0253 [Candidatus Jorgensenbacteria bacterium GW2011_GWA1_48_13]KKW14861.1 MAG: hypothetical protein UY55_C0003G0078 [Candidatus Jorgensenbacteria bacterium GW2011_GWB1_50_10]
METKNFDENLEKSLSRLGKQIETESRVPEAKELHEKELVKLSLKSIAEESKSERSTEEESAPPVREPKATLLPSYLQNDGVPENVKTEIEGLINLVFAEGLEKALVEAERHGPFVEDAFHDALVDKLLPELKKRGILS